VFLIEDFNLGGASRTNNPNQETPNDTADTLNLELCTEITTAAAAALVELANQ